MQEYVAGFMFCRNFLTPMVRKLKPAAHIGLFNGIGGKVEAGETPLAAMIREWKEETTWDHADWSHFVSIKGENSHVHFYKAFVNELPLFDDTNDAGEQIRILDAHRVQCRHDIVENVRWLVPLALDTTGLRIVA